MVEQLTSIGSELISGALVIGVGILLLKWLLKKQVDDLFGSIKATQQSVVATKTELAEIIKENDKKTNERITKLEEYTHREIGDIKKEVNSIKGDFATSFVLREDFFRFGNGVEESIKAVDQKIDKLIFTVAERKGKES